MRTAKTINSAGLAAKRWLLTAVLALAAVSTLAQDAPVAWSLASAAIQKPLTPGVKFSVKLTAKIDPGWHLYALRQMPDGPEPTRIVVPARQPFALAGAVEGPPPLTKFDPNFEVDTAFHEKSAAFTLPISVAANAPVGRHRLAVEVTYQACNAELCLPPNTAKIELPLVVERKASKIPKPRETPGRQTSR
jgi:thiol:disulfide interchange protein DsbD